MMEIQASGAKYVLILAGDHLYRMNYKAMAEYHWENKADITVAVQPVAKEEADRFGVLKRESDGKISDFFEKPKDPETQKRFVSRDDPKRPYLGSMGIYMFNTKVLVDFINNFPDYDDFGGDIIPQAIKTHQVFGFDFDGYWQDIGTIRSFYETNLMLTRSDSPFDFYDAKLPIYTDTRYLPASIVEDCKFKDVLIAEGSRVLKSDISHSIIGIRSQIAADCVIKDSIVMGSDYFERDSGVLPIGIGTNCHIEGAILDKNVRIGSNVTIRPFPRNTDIDHEKWYVRDGIVIIPKDVEIPPDTVIAP
jgi:glucose-1-phosphate adenylyltransferase